VTDLRLWSGSGTGVSGLNLLDSLMENEVGLTLNGGYRWLPPLRIMPGTGQFHPLIMQSNYQWTDMDFMKYAGEDVLSDPYPLEYRPLWTDGDPLLVAIRVIAGLAKQNRSIVVPYSMSTNSTTVHVNLAARTTDRARVSLSHDGLVKCLIFKEPSDENWTIWDSVEIGPDDLLSHLVGWATYLEILRDTSFWGDRNQIENSARLSLTDLGVDVEYLRADPIPDNVSHPFARILAGRIRFSSGIGLGQVGPIR